MAEGVPARLSVKEGRRFGLQVGTAFLALGALAGWRGHLRSAVVLAALGGALLTGGFFVPTRLDPIYRGWMRLASIMARFTTPIVMGALYFLVITPAGLLLRAFGHRPLASGRRAPTVWVSRAGTGGWRSDLKRQF